MMNSFVQKLDSKGKPENLVILDAKLFQMEQEQ